MREEIKFNMVLPGSIDESQIAALLPDLLLKEENLRGHSRVAHSDQMNISWQSTRLENNDWSVNGFWKAKD